MTDVARLAVIFGPHKVHIQCVCAIIVSVMLQTLYTEPPKNLQRLRPLLETFIGEADIFVWERQIAQKSFKKKIFVIFAL